MTNTVERLIAELEAMIRVWENGWKVDKDIYIANAREAIRKAREDQDGASC